MEGILSGATVWLLCRLLLLYYHEAISKWISQIKHGEYLYRTNMQNIQRTSTNKQH
jgi:hypothetical protein